MKGRRREDNSDLILTDLGLTPELLTCTAHSEARDERAEQIGTDTGAAVLADHL